MNGHCYIQCSEFEGCQGIIINAIHSNSLSIEALNGGKSVLKDANITCPSNYHKNHSIITEETTCSINVIAQSVNDQHQIGNLTIYSVQSFNNLHISCTNYHLNERMENTCFDLNENPKLYCTESFEDHCNIQYNSNQNYWECMVSSSVCDNYHSKVCVVHTEYLLYIIINVFLVRKKICIAIIRMNQLMIGIGVI